ncbi:MAG: HEAT repeat domain-containing protein [Candidatus Acidiferrales bacterium]
MSSPTTPAAPPRKPLGARWTYIVLGITLAFVLMPFLLWRATWFGRPLTNAQLEQSLHDTQSPRDVQHGLSSIADRIIRNDPTVKQFYPQVVTLASSPAPEIRTLAAWVMGQDNTSTAFHGALLRLLNDPNPMVRRNAALGLVRFHDATGHAVILSMLRASSVNSPCVGSLKTRLKPGQTVNLGGLIAQVQTPNGSREVRSEMPGTLERWLVKDGANVFTGQPIAAILPGDDAVWEALRALYLIGTPADLDAIAPYTRGGGGAPRQIAEQARLTMQEIRARASAPTASPAPQ